MIDDGEIIKPGDIPNNIEGLINLEECTEGRFRFRVDPSGTFALCTWYNHKRDKKGKRYKKDGDWARTETFCKKVGLRLLTYAEK